MNRNNKSIFNGELIRGSARAIASIYESKAKTAEGYMVHMYLQHAEHWRKKDG